MLSSSRFHLAVATIFLIETSPLSSLIVSIFVSF
jgi:hypothetical protein